MRQFNFLSKLLDAQPGTEPYISIYLNTGPNENGKKEFDIFLKKQLSDHMAVLEQGSTKRDAFQADSEKINEFVESLDPSVRGVAIFAGSGNNDFFETYEFAVPFEENQFHVFERPFVSPLVRLVDQHPTFATVAADTNSAHIYVFRRAEITRREDIQNTKTNRSEVGGWSQMRYQRHIENFHQQHAKEVIAELDKIVSNDRIEYVVLAGDEAVIIPLLREEMTEQLSKKVVATLPLNVNTPEHEVSEAAREALAESISNQEKELIENLFEVNYDDGVGVTGFEKTLSALLNGQVQELYLSSNLDDIGFNRENVKVLLKDYAPGLDDEMPDTRERELMIDELIRQAATSADEIRFIGDEHLLKTAGGVGAILRYQAKGVSNS